MKEKLKFTLLSLATFVMNCNLVLANFAGKTQKIEDVLGGDPAVRPIGENFVSNFLGTFQYIGYAIAIGMLIYIGIKYVSVAAEERANVKELLKRYVIGAVLIVCASFIVGAVKDIV